MQSQSADLQRNNVLPEIYLIICEIFRLKLVISNFLHSKGAFLSNCEKNDFLKQTQIRLKGGLKRL